MPKAVARKVEFTIAKFDLNVDLQLIPLALTPDQCRTYNLPRTPIKDTERRKDKFEQTFGVGATELDALEALHPGRIGPSPQRRARQLARHRICSVASTVAQRNVQLRLRKIESEAKAGPRRGNRDARGHASGDRVGLEQTGRRRSLSPATDRGGVGGAVP